MMVYDSYFQSDSFDTLVCLHGFLGSKDEFEWLVRAFGSRMNIVCVGLPYHDENSIEYHPTLTAIAEQLKQNLDDLSLDSVKMYGYSLGGRVAMMFMSLYSERCSGLVIESAHIGCSTEDERVESESLLQKNLSRFSSMTYDDFLLKWYQQDLFSKTRDLLSEESIERKQSLHFKDLLHLYECCHVSKQPYFGELFARLRCPVLYIAGEYDEKYVQKAHFLNETYGVDTKIIKYADHNVHVSAVEELVLGLKTFF
ncbi:hypothetical protein DID78_07235 [Candidatus Marinamargulisbacteria bacterium SCGC AG-343-D04]|nr:hypothetical protein DID78_07235 [Candidatus Marinamargulisbacteria bacterium SCGC AG-343-D04]